MNAMKYKGYIGLIEYNDEDRLFYGKVQGILDVLTFQGATVDELEKDFHEMIDEYLVLCEKRGRSPEKPFSGRFSTRLNPETHRLIALAAKSKGKSINAWVSETLAHIAQEQIGA